MYTEKKKEWAKEYYKKNKARSIAYATEYHFKNRETINKRKAEKRREVAMLRPYKERPRSTIKLPFCTKQEVIEKYGGLCVCCGEAHLRLLTIDHINNDGHAFKQGKTRLKGSPLYGYLKKEGFPLNVQVLCFNCNIGRHNNGGVCPHKGENPKA